MARVLHLDMDSFFATVEQQSRPHLRGKAVGIAPIDSPGGTIIAASIAAKKLGVGTGTKIAEAKLKIPDIVILPPTPQKYRTVHRRFRAIMEEYASMVKPRSVDEIAIWLEPNDKRPAFEIGAEIKQRIRDEVGEYLSSSVGIGPNWLLAKTASNMRKPDGLYEITRENARGVLAELDLTDLCGIADRMKAKMNVAGIRSPTDLYDLPPWELKRRLGIVGYYWHLRLRGYSIDQEDWGTKTLGHSSVIGKATNRPEEIRPLVHKLCHKIARRLRKDGWQAGGIAISGTTRDWGKWGHSTVVPPTYRQDILYRAIWKILQADPPAEPLRKIAITSYDLRPLAAEQLSLFVTDQRKHSALAGADLVNDKWGDFTVIPGTMVDTKVEEMANDAIAFGQDLKLQREAPVHRERVTLETEE